MKTIKYLIISILLSTPLLGMAQGVMEKPWVNDTILLYAIYAVIALLLLVMLLLYRIIRHMRSNLDGVFIKDEEVHEHVTNRFRGVERFLQLKPVSSDRDTVLADHDYDGIQELDNPPPPWFMVLFYGTILFAVVYLAGYTFTKAWPGQMEEYEAGMAKIESSKTTKLETEEAGIDENNVLASTEAADIQAGKAIYVSKCEVCHLENGKGMTGPNLTDDYWIHGGSDAEIFKIIKYGVVEKGMIPWKDQLSPKMMQDLVSYIQSLEYIGPENGGKEPQGELVQSAGSTTSSADSSAIETDSTSK